MDKKPLLIIFEGRDKAGKSTLYQAFRRATNYQPLAIDRFIGSNIVYDKVYSRKETTEEEYLEMEKTLFNSFRPIVVFVDAPTSVLLWRARKAGTDGEEAGDIKAAKFFYDEYIKKTAIPVIEINSSAQGIQSCVKIILDGIKEMEEKNVWQ